MNKNDTVTLEITAITDDGYGIGRVNDTVVFVPFAAVGDVVEALIIKVKKSYCIGKLLNIKNSSKDRIEPDCNVFSRCGGCALRHISYDAEKRLKRQRVIDCMTRIGGLDIEVESVESNDIVNEYRNKSQYPVGLDSDKPVCGFYALHSHRIVECDRCKLTPPEFDEIRDTVLYWSKVNRVMPYDEKTGKGVLRHIFIRKAPKTSEIAVCVVSATDKMKNEQTLVETLLSVNKNIKTIAVNINKSRTNVILGNKTKVLYGNGYIIDNLCGLNFRIGIRSFYQVNSPMAEKLYNKVSELAEPSGKNVLDLYCGAGTIGLSMADEAKQIIGVEIVDEAVEDAKYNAKLNGIDNARFICSNASDAAEKLVKEGITPDVVVVDPPRKGLDSKLINTISNDFSPKKIVYVSCDPATLARDLKQFNELGYKTTKAYPFDLFPRTPHVETVVLLSKLKSTHHIEVEIELDKMDLTKAESKATYAEIKDYVLKKYGLKVSQLYIAQVKRKHGIIERANYNVGEGKNRVPKVTPEKESAIEDALRYFQMIE